LILLLAGVIALVSVNWLLGREQTVRWLVELAQQYVPGKLQIEGVRGSLYGAITFERLRYEDDKRIVLAEAGRVHPSLGMLRQRHVALSEVHVARLSVQPKIKDDSPLELPATLILPFRLSLGEVRVDRLDIHSLESAPLVLRNLAMQASFDGVNWRLRRTGGDTPWGSFTLSGDVAGSAPFAVSAQAALSGTQSGHTYQVPLTLAGTLASLQLNSRFTVDGKVGTFEGRVQPFGADASLNGLIIANAIALHELGTGLPQATLDTRLSVQAVQTRPSAPGRTQPAQSAQGAPALVLSGQLDIVNRTPGALDASRLPVQRARIVWSGDMNNLVARVIDLDLGSAGRLSGSGRYLQGVPSADLRAVGVALQALHARLPALTVNGPLRVMHDGQALAFNAELSDGKRSLRGQGRLPDDVPGSVRQLEIITAELRAGASRAILTGRIGIESPNAFHAQATLQNFDPAQFADAPSARLNGKVEAEGRFAPSLEARIAADLGPSRWRDRTLSGQARANLTAQAVRDVDIKVALGANRLEARGNLGNPADRLTWSLDATRLADISAGLGGALRASGEASGTWQAPRIQFNATGQALVFNPQPGTPSAAHRLTRLETQGVLDLRQGGQLDARLTASGYNGPAGPIPQAQLTLAGSREKHSLDLALRRERMDATARLQGGLFGPWATAEWRGRLESLENRGTPSARLLQPVDLTLAAGRLAINGTGGARFAIDDGELAISQLQIKDGEIVSAGTLRRVVVPAALLQGSERRFVSSLRLSGSWSVSWGKRADAQVRLTRDSGDVVLNGSPNLPLGLERLVLDARLQDGRITGTLDLASKETGQANVQMNTELTRTASGWEWPRSAPLGLTARLDIPRLRAFAPLLGVDKSMRFDGRLRADITGQGTRGDPRLSGQMQGNDLNFAWPVQGIDWQKGQFTGRFEGDRLRVNALLLRSGDGTLEATGDLLLGGDAPRGTFDISMKQFTAVSRPDRLLVASGQGRVELADNRVSVSGKLVADRGQLQLQGGEEGITRSSDIVFVGRQQPAKAGQPGQSVVTATEARAPLNVNLDVEVDFGKNMRVTGAGLEGRLAGQFRVVSTGGSTPSAVGTLNIVEGVYSAYGQRLVIEYGALIFSGLVTNPGLDLLAVRKGLAVVPGVQVRGTAQAPRATLVSTPDVPDTEKLSWLVLGRASYEGRNELALLSAVAQGLLGRDGGPSLQAPVATRLGIDEFSVGGANDGTTGLLTLGKRLSSRLFVSYEQGLGTISNVLRIRYDLSQRWAVEVRAGTETAVDVLYTFRFD